MKHKNILIFIIITFFRSIIISMLKFFLRSLLKDVHISLEEIMGYLSLGGAFAYIFGSAITYRFHKKHIIIWTGCITILCLLLGKITEYYPFRIFIGLISCIGFIYSLRLIIKSIILSTEIQESGYGETKINGVVNIAILGGMLLGSYLGFFVFEKRKENGVRGIILFMSIIIIGSFFMEYDQKFEQHTIIHTLKRSINNIRGIIKKYSQLLIPIGVLRAISTAIGQKMLEIGVDIFERTTKDSITIIIMGLIGSIIGHIISVFFTKKRKITTTIFTIIFGLTTIYFPHIINKYDYYITLNILGCLTGIFFGIAVNLLEGRFFFHIGEDHRKEYGSVAYGIVTNIIIFIIMFIADILSKKIGIKISFFFFGIVLLVMPFLIKNFENSHLSKQQ